MMIEHDTLRDYCTLDRIDYSDAHFLRTDRTSDRTPEMWAREIIENTSAAMRARLTAGWTMLGLRLHPFDSHAVAGWPIAHSSAEYVRLQGDSRIGLTGQIIARGLDDGVVLSTFIQLGNPVVRALWNKVEPAHLQIVASLLREAGDRVG